MTSATIRVFRAPDARAALEAIKASLGPDAVILGTRQVKGGLFKRPEVEVTAGLPGTAASRTTVAQKYDAAPPEKAAPPASPPGLQPAASLRDELVKLRREVDSLREGRPAPRPTHAQALLRHLVERGMEDELAEDVVSQATERAQGGGTPALVDAARDVLAERVLASRAPWLPDRKRLIGLIGPTGVGKTTTLAKMAALALQAQQKVGLITVDTFRVGASEQLGHYGAIMKVPSYVARDRTELERAVTQCNGCDLVLIDTAGCSDPLGVERQAQLVRGISGTRLFLVASVAAGARDLAAVAERYRPLAPDRVILTKLDEAAAPAGFLSATLRLSRPIVATCHGQRVPEDIRPASTPELVELLLGGVPL